MTVHAPFSQFAPAIDAAKTPLREAITAATRRPERECVAALLPEATLPEPVRASAQALARTLVEALRARPRGNGVDQLVQEYALSTHEGVALMCLAEALLRIPDNDTRDDLIRDKIAGGDWQAHLGSDRSLFVNAATWGLVVTGKLTGTLNTGNVDDSGLGTALSRLLARAGEPVIRRGVDLAMRMMGEQFVTGETIAKALKRAGPLEQRGFSYSYDMLGEAAMTAQDAARYYADYEAAIEAIGAASAGRGIHDGPGISIKLSALHPRYARAQQGRLMAELLPRVKALAVQALRHDIGFNIDAEESDRLELSLDLLEALATDPELAGWNGLGFVVQAYGKRCPFVIDWIVDLARRSGRRIMVRLVKGAYWDAEIKRAQVDGQADFPVYTRKVHTDLAYIACARRLLAARDAVFPQFATHNAHTLATIKCMADAIASPFSGGPKFRIGDYEFQCLHGMGEPLYDEVVGPDKLNRPCRIYAPVGTHETLLAYLVRRLLENGANASFVNRIANPDVPTEAIIADPVAEVASADDPGAPHPLIALPQALFPERRNSTGIDLADEATLASISQRFASVARQPRHAAPGADLPASEPRRVANPANHADLLGTVRETLPEAVPQAARLAAASRWSSALPPARAVVLERAANAMQTALPELIALLVREAGKSVANAIAEVREAVDFLRYYAAQQAVLAGAEPLGVAVCISPWNFPLAIFTGQIAAALMAGNSVLAKPAEETPLIAAEAVRILHEAGIPDDALILVPGDGTIGAALVAAPETAAVLFTGSTEVGRLIQRQLATRLSPGGRPVPLIAETGGQNAMIVDSSALAEQVVADVIASAFDSAGQRCSALRVLCLQRDIADRVLGMLRGAMAELNVGPTDRLCADIGPVITAQAQDGIEAHVAQMQTAGCPVHRLVLPPETANGTFVAPTIIELEDPAQLTREVFGPVLHVIRFDRDDMDALVDRINAWGYGLTFGLHTRLDQTVERVTARAQAGNIYVNRNVIGAVVGVQPFGGHGLSGTGPKAGGPLYLRRLLAAAPAFPAVVPGERDLAGPVGERNVHALRPIGKVLIAAQDTARLAALQSRVGALGGTPVVADPGWQGKGPFARALVDGDAAFTLAFQQALAALPGAIVPLLTPADGDAMLVCEVSLSINTTAAGGNASLMAIA
ncbi:MAG: bifunctional proline dehydrogenase/L-glutamate gamma-semialdehyde dehydrogenase PutA [Novosphingobium sp.]|nr:bifunctional proline dehydrogenase/L-glutamate gamma-semialdehyde dehydrogenase PutA [Novosphingobium sp.]